MSCLRYDCGENNKTCFQDMHLYDRRRQKLAAPAPASNRERDAVLHFKLSLSDLSTQPNNIHILMHMIFNSKEVM